MSRSFETSAISNPANERKENSEDLIPQHQNSGNLGFRTFYHTPFRTGQSEDVFKHNTAVRYISGDYGIHNAINCINPHKQLQHMDVFLWDIFLSELFPRLIHITPLTFWRRNYFLNFNTPCI